MKRALHLETDLHIYRDRAGEHNRPEEKPSRMPVVPCTFSITNYTIDIYLVRVHLMFSASRPKNERFIDGQLSGSWGAFFT